MSETPWSLESGAPCLGEHNQYVFGELLGRSEREFKTLFEEGLFSHATSETTAS